jgi:predicted nucleotidyltransferase
VIPGDPNVQRVERVAAALGELLDQLVLVGGCAASLLIDRATASPPRVTFDVDLIAEVAGLRGYNVLEKAIALRGFSRDRSADAPICRWTLGPVKVDLMPTDEAVLGFSNPWYLEAMRSATLCILPSGLALQLISAPAFIATKFAAFDSRGRGDMAASHDFEDIINIVEGRSTLVAEIRAASRPLRDHVVQRIAAIVADEAFRNALPGLVTADDLHAERVKIVLARLADLGAS